MITKLFWVLFVQTYSTFYLDSIRTHAMLDVLHIKNVCKWCISQSQRTEPSFFFWRSKCHKFTPNSISSDQLHCHLRLIYFQLGWFAAYQRGTGGASTILRSCRISALTPLRNPNECFSYLHLIQESVSALPSSHVKLNVFLDLKLGFFILFTSF